MAKKAGKIGRNRVKIANKSKVKKWKKGHSCVTNPETVKHRTAAKSRFFSVNTGPSSLTVDAVSRLEASHTENDEEDDKFDVHSLGGRSAKTSTSWASNFTSCTNVSFNKVLHRYSTSRLAAHKEVLAVLAATAEVIRSQGGKETDTEYFAMLMSSLNSETLQEEQSMAAAAYLLSIIIKRVPTAVLKSRFSDTAKVLLSILCKYSTTSAPSLLRSVIACLQQLLLVQDLSTWNNEETKHIYYTLLTTILSPKAKVRKAAQLAVGTILRHGSLLSESGSSAYHPAAAQTAMFCVRTMRESGGGGNAPVSLHVLELLRGVLDVFPKNSLKTTCEAIAQIMTLSNAMLSCVAMKTLKCMFTAQPSVETLPAEYNAKIITPSFPEENCKIYGLEAVVHQTENVLYDYKPNDADIQPMQTWLSTMTQAHINLARLDASLCLVHLPRLFSTAMKSLQTVNLSKSTADEINTLIKQCIGPSVVLASTMISDAPSGTSSPIHKLFRTIESGLGYQYFAVWDVVLIIISQIFEVLGKDCHSVMKKCFRTLADLRDTAGFQHRDLLDRAVGMAIKKVGPKVFLEVVPLQITGDSMDSFARSWLLPVMRDHIEETEIAFFVVYFLPLAQTLEKKCAVLKAEKRMVECKTYETLQNQIWSLLPAFCTKPTDLLQEKIKWICLLLQITSSDSLISLNDFLEDCGSKSFSSIAKTIGTTIRDRTDCRLDLLNALRKLINQNMDNEKERAVMARYAQNFLPILFNLYTSQPASKASNGESKGVKVGGGEEKRKNPTMMAVLETAKVYFKITDVALVSQYAEKCYEKLTGDESTAEQKHLLMDIVISFVPHIPKVWLDKYLTLALGGLKSIDKTRQKKSYRMLEEMCKSDASQLIVKKRLSDIQTELVENLSTSGPSSKAPRLRCLLHLMQQIKSPAIDLMTSVIAEVVLCTKATGEKARSAAFTLLSEMANIFIGWHPNTDKKDSLCRYFALLMPGLAGNNPQHIACTVLALTKLIFDFKGLFGIDILRALVDSVCLLLMSHSREVLHAALGLLKALVSAFASETFFSPFVQKLVSAIVSINEKIRIQLRVRVKDIYKKLIRRFGYAVIVGMVPEGQRKLLNNIRKIEERAKRQKNEENEEDEDDGYVVSKPKPNPESIDDLLRDTDSDESDSEVNKSKKKKKSSSGSLKGAAWLKEDDDIVDFLDSSAAKKVTMTRPMVKLSSKQQNDQSGTKHGFKMSSDGRMIITETEDDAVVKKKGGGKKINKDEDDLDDLFNSMESAAPQSRKRKRDKASEPSYDDDDDDDIGSAKKAKYKAGGGGIHRPVGGGSTGGKRNKPEQPGKEFKAKKAVGDVKKKNSVDPYAYVPLQFQYLNKRKKAKASGQFKNFVSGARKGAQKGSKQKQKHRGKN